MTVVEIYKAIVDLNNKVISQEVYLHNVRPEIEKLAKEGKLLGLKLNVDTIFVAISNEYWENQPEDDDNSSSYEEEASEETSDDEDY